MRPTLKFLGLLIVVLLSTPSYSIENNLNTAGEFEFRQEGGRYVPALLLNTEVTGEVNGLIANIVVHQTFKNESDDWVNGRYVFPLPEGAAVDSLTITVGERIIEGIVQEKAAAKQAFEQAKKEGKKAALLEQHRPNLFSMSVANIAPQSEIKTTITYVERVRYDQQTFSLRLPTTLTPRYIPGVPLAKHIEAELEKEISRDQQITVSSNGWSPNTTQVKDANEITPPQMHATRLDEDESKNTHQFNLDIKLNAGMALSSITSNSHAISSTEINPKTHSIQLSNGTELMDRDLVIQWQTSTENSPKAALFQQNKDGEHYSMLMFMPPSVDIDQAIPRDVTFIIDSSGSMAGDSMQQAKASLLQALSTLTPNDRFNVVDFDSNYNALFNNSMPANNRSLRQARNMINGLVADGGTEMLGALRFALNQTHDENTLNQIVFITDGSIGNETALFKLIQTQLGDRRLFTIGIGSAPNAYFMRKAAKFGRGTYTFIGYNDDVNQLMGDLFIKMSRPVLKDIQIDWGKQQVETYPKRIPDLYLSEPLMVVTKSNQPLTEIKIKGSLLGKDWLRSINNKKTENDNADNLDTVWARSKVTHLMDKMVTGELSQQEAKPEIIQLGIAHQIVTKFTSFVAIEKTPSRPFTEKAKHKLVPNLMPKGNAMQAPQTSTPAALLSLIGGLLILLSQISRRVANRYKLQGGKS